MTGSSSRLDHTHDPGHRSWVGSGGRTGFRLQTLPYGVFSRSATADRRRPCVGIGDHLLDLAAAAEAGLLNDVDTAVRGALQAPVLNPLLALAPGVWRDLRHRLFALLLDDDGGWRGARETVARCLVPQSAVQMHLPIAIGDYTDFYASIHHATNVGRMMRPDQPLLPNYRHVPIGYHGRASSVVVSGTPVRRPAGQTLPQGGQQPVFGPSQRLDYELEVGLVIGGENALGDAEPIGRARDRVFGIVLLNDWSARDVQAWEYQPLGPFLAKSFATTLSAWIVPLDALAPLRAAATPRSPDDPSVMDYLYDEEDQATGAFDLPLEVRISSERMQHERTEPMVVSRSNLQDLYWTPAQLVAHHTSNGCNLRPGDLLGTGTVSGATPESRGCLLERTWRGTEPLPLPTGESRRFLEDGDAVTLSSPAFPELSCTGTIIASQR